MNFEPCNPPLIDPLYLSGVTLLTDIFKPITLRQQDLKIRLFPEKMSPIRLFQSDHIPQIFSACLLNPPALSLSPAALIPLITLVMLQLPLLWAASVLLPPPHIVQMRRQLPLRTPLSLLPAPPPDVMSLNLRDKFVTLPYRHLSTNSISIQISQERYQYKLTLQLLTQGWYHQFNLGITSANSRKISPVQSYTTPAYPRKISPVQCWKKSHRSSPYSPKSSPESTPVANKSDKRKKRETRNFWVSVEHSQEVVQQLHLPDDGDENRGKQGHRTSGENSHVLVPKSEEKGQTWNFG